MPGIPIITKYTLLEEQDLITNVKVIDPYQTTQGVDFSTAFCKVCLTNSCQFSFCLILANREGGTLTFI